MRKFFIATAFLTVLFVGCRKKNDPLNTFILTTFPDLKSGEILVIPNSGCNSCISDAENSIDSLIKIKNFKFIFTQIQSLKTLNYRLKKKNINLKSPSIFVDTTNLYIKNSEDYRELWSFPTKITVKDERIIKVSRL